MNKVARFEKVSFRQFKKDMQLNSSFDDQQIQDIYDGIKLPERATKSSAGYDFYMPYDVKIDGHDSKKIITGIRCRIDEQWVLMIFPRSSLGFKYRMQLSNTVGIIDSDYYGANNEGHIIIKVSNDDYEKQPIELSAGSRFAQGVFVMYGITEDDEAEGMRTRGFGSTDKI